MKNKVFILSGEDHSSTEQGDPYALQPARPRKLSQPASPLVARTPNLTPPHDYPGAFSHKFIGQLIHHLPRLTSCVAWTAFHTKHATSHVADLNGARPKMTSGSTIPNTANNPMAFRSRLDAAGLSVHVMHFLRTMTNGLGFSRPTTLRSEICKVNNIDTSHGYENGHTAWKHLQQWLLQHWTRKIPQHQDELEAISEKLEFMWKNPNGPIIDVLSKTIIMAIYSDAEGVSIVARREGKVLRIKLSAEPAATELSTLREFLRELDTKPTMLMIL